MRIPERVRAIELPQFDVLNDIAASWRARGADVIGLGQALPGFAPPPVALTALKAALDDPTTQIYSSDAGIPQLRHALARSLAALQATVDPEREIIITAGGNQAFHLALTTLVDPGEEVILPGPYFLNHEMSVQAVGAIPVEAPVPASRQFVPTWDAIEPHVTLRTRAVVLVSPSNPTGAIIPRPELERIAAECAARDVILIVDETYMRFVYEGQPFTAAALPHWGEHVVIVGSFSKTLAITGWRCGYLLANAHAISEAMKIQDCMIICAPVPVQRAVAAVLDKDPDYTTGWLPELRQRRDALFSGLCQIQGLEPARPAGGFFIMVKFAGCTDSRALALDLVQKEQLVTIPGRFFGRSGEGYLRLSYGAATTDQLREACRRLARYVDHTRQSWSHLQ